MSKAQVSGETDVQTDDEVPEGNRTVTLHNRSWQQILRLLERESEETGNPTPRTIANTIEAQGVDFETE